MASTAPTGTNCAQSTFGTAWKAGQVIPRLFVASFWLAGRSDGFTTLYDPVRPWLRPEDVDIALDIDRYNFAVRVNFDAGNWLRVWKDQLAVQMVQER